MITRDRPVPDIALDVNLRNPGQFFACCGLLELASRLWSGSEGNGWRAPEGWFEGKHVRGRFYIATHSGHDDPLGEIVRTLCEADPLVVVPQDEGIERVKEDRQPVILCPFGLRLDWWLDAFGDGDKSELKIWAGRQTPAGKIRDLQAAWRTVLARGTAGQPATSLFAQCVPTDGRFGFDPAASWEAIDIGFSPDAQNVPVQTSPAVELLAAVGLQRCRPRPVAGKRRWFTYHVWGDPLDATVVPAAVVGAGPDGPGFEFCVVMRSEQYASFGWANPLEVQR